MSAKMQTRVKDRKSSLKRTHRPVAQEHHSLTRPAHPTAAILQRAQRNPGLLTPQNVLQLQRAIGNRAVRRLLGAKGQQPAAGRLMPSLTSQPIQRLIDADAFAQETIGTGKVSQPGTFFSKVVTRLKEYHGKLKSVGLRSQLGHLNNLLHEVQKWIKGVGQGSKYKGKVEKLNTELIDEMQTIVLDKLSGFKFSKHFKKQGEEWSKDAWKAGALSQVDRILYKFGIRMTGKGFEKVKVNPKKKKTEGFWGVFKAMETYDKESHLGSLMGIPKQDPGFHLRTLAMYKLDQLLGANVIPPTFLAKHSGKLGTVMEQIKGPTVAVASKGIANFKSREREEINQNIGFIGYRLKNDKLTEQERQDCLQEKRTWEEKRDKLNAEQEKLKKKYFDNPTYRRSFSILMLLDTIAGQVDRHDKNYIVQMEGGVIKGVKGIDNDLAFGFKYNKAKLELYFKEGKQPVMKNGKPAKDKHGKQVFEVAGYIPSELDEIDHDFAKKIIETAENQQQLVREALKGLLSEGEIKATIGRLTALAEWLKPLMDKKDGPVVTEWK